LDWEAEEEEEEEEEEELLINEQAFETNVGHFKKIYIIAMGEN